MVKVVEVGINKTEYLYKNLFIVERKKVINPILVFEIFKFGT